MSRILLGSSGRFGYIELPNQLLNVTEQQITADVNYAYSLFNSFTGNRLLKTNQFTEHQCTFDFIPHTRTRVLGEYAHSLHGTIIDCAITLQVPYDPTTLYHELAHLFTGSVTGSTSRLPGILTEGIAKYVEYIYHPLGNDSLTWDKLDSYTFIQNKSIASFGQLISSTNSNYYKYRAGNAFVAFCKHHSPNAITDYLSDLYYVGAGSSFNYKNNIYLDNLLARCPWNSFIDSLNAPNAIQPYTIISNCYNNSADAWVCPNSAPQTINNNSLLSNGCNPFSRFPGVANAQEFIWNNEAVKISIEPQRITRENQNGTTYEYMCDGKASDWLMNAVGYIFNNQPASCPNSIVNYFTNLMSSSCKPYTLVSNCDDNNSATAWVCSNSAPQTINNNNLLSYGCTSLSGFPKVTNAQGVVWNNQSVKLSIQQQLITLQNRNEKYEYKCGEGMLGWVWNSVKETFSNQPATCANSIVDALTNAISSRCDNKTISIVDALTNAISSGCKNNTIASYTTAPVSTSTIYTTSGYSISNMTDTYSTYSTNYIPNYPQEDSTFFNWKTISLLVIGGGVLLISGLTSLFCYCKNQNRITGSEDTEVPNDSEGFELITKSGEQNDTSMIGAEWTLV